MTKSEIIALFASRRFEQLSAEALATNEFFTLHSIQTAARAIVQSIPDQEVIREPNSKTVVVVCAGNIPLVGFSDTYSAILSGAANVVVKPSRRDPLMRIFDEKVEIVEQLPQSVDTILAMGSDRTMAALAEQYPHAQLHLRGTELSCAVLTGHETPEQMAGLAEDMFLHSAMGCRSVTHLHLPAGYDLAKLAFAPRADALPAAWYNNYRYQKAMAAMHNLPLTDGGYYLLAQGFSQSISVVGYTFYDAIENIDWGATKIKSIVAAPAIAHRLPIAPTNFGQGQFPEFEFDEI